MRPLAGLVVALSFPGAALAQNSVYSVLGAGLPGRPIGVHARALAGGIGAFDPASAVNPAAVAGFTRLSVGANLTGSFRSYEAGESSADGLRQTRFPFAYVGSRVGRTPVSFAAGYATYLDRTFDITSSDTVMLRGAPVAVEDRLASDGSSADIRGALGVRIGNRLQIGGAVHVISGSTRMEINRTFSDSTFLTVRDSSQATFTAVGFSAGAIVMVSPRLRIAASFRSDTDIEETIDSVPVADVDLPVTVSGGVLVVPTAALRWSATVSWRSWSDAGAALGRMGGSRAFDTWEVGSGIEFGGTDVGASGFPLRVGVRYAQLPFSPSDDQPEEWVVSAGTAIQFASNRALLETTLERVFRDGGGASERVWQVSVGLRLVP